MRKATRVLLNQCLEIAHEYDGNLTLRQLYYQLVARGLLDNSQKQYKRVGGLLAKARLRGDFPLHLIIDRTREVIPGNSATFKMNVDTAIDDAVSMVEYLPELVLDRGSWFDQPKHVSVFLEKQALAGVFEPICNELGVNWFISRGYASISSLYQWLLAVGRTEEARRDAFHEDVLCECRQDLQPVILQFGDHDPDGLEIPCSIKRNLKLLAARMGANYEAIADNLHVERCALTLEQIREHDAPPFYAKASSSRHASYIQKTGLEHAWELDALPPLFLQELIREQVDMHFDHAIYGVAQDRLDDVRAQFRLEFKGVMQDMWGTP